MDERTKERVIHIVFRRLPYAITRGHVEKTRHFMDVLYALQPLDQEGAAALHTLVEALSNHRLVLRLAHYFYKNDLLPSWAAFEVLSRALRMRDLTPRGVSTCWHAVWEMTTYLGRSRIHEVATWCIGNPKADNSLRHLIMQFFSNPDTQLALARCPAAREDLDLVKYVFVRGESPEAMTLMARSISAGQVQALVHSLLDEPVALSRTLQHLGPAIHHVPQETITILLQHRDRDVRLHTMAALGAPSTQEPTVEDDQTPDFLLSSPEPEAFGLENPPVRRLSQLR